MKFFREKIFKKLFIPIIYFTCFFNLPFLTAIILRMQCFSLNSIKIKKNYRNKNLIIFFKSAGVDDVISAFEKNYSKKNIIFLPRFNFQKIETYFFGGYDIQSIKKNKSNYNKCSLFIDAVLKNFKNLFNNEIEFLSFNLSYPEEKIIREICFKKKIKFFVLHKESVRSPGYEKMIFKKFQKQHKSFNNLTKVAVYNSSSKKQLIKHKLIEGKKISIVGFPRGIYSLRKKKNSFVHKDTILYFMISSYASTLRKVSWSKIASIVEKTLFELAKTNSKIQFIFKGKTNMHTEKIKNLRKYNNLSNVKYIDGGSGHNLITSRSIVIGFNSTAIMESLISDNDIIVPFFKKFRKPPYLEYAHVYNPKLFVNDENDFKNKIIQKLKNRKKIEDKTFYQKIIKHYFDDIQNAPRKLRKFLQ